MERNQPQEHNAGEAPYLTLARHYEACLETHGANYKGVDWPNEEDLKVRFDVMLNVIKERQTRDAIELLDLGCGPGLLLDHLVTQKSDGPDIHYQGIDISEPMIEAAQNLHPDHKFAVRNLLTNPIAPQSVDYVVMNGVLTEKRELSFEAMENFATELIAAAFHSAKKGIAFNVMSPNVDWQRDDLFHWPFDAMARSVHKLTRHMVIRADYGLHEYTTYLYRGVAPDGR